MAPLARLSKKELEVLVDKHYPHFRMVPSTVLLEKLIKEGHGADLSRENLENQLKNPHSALAKIFYACILFVVVAEAEKSFLNQQNLRKQHEESLTDLRLKDTNKQNAGDLNQMESNISRVVESEKETKNYVEEIKVSTELLTKYKEQIETIKGMQSILASEIRHDTRQARVAFNSALEQHNIPRNSAFKFAVTMPLQAKINQAVAQMAQQNAGDSEEEFQQKLVGAVQVMITDSAKVRNANPQELNNFNAHSRPIVLLLVSRTTTINSNLASLHTLGLKLQSLENESRKIEERLNQLQRMNKYGSIQQSNLLSSNDSIAESVIRNLAMNSPKLAPKVVNDDEDLQVGRSYTRRR
jgi:hypothetical protein